MVSGEKLGFISFSPTCRAEIFITAARSDGITMITRHND